jgi:outer membrane autotransporter protein
MPLPAGRGSVGAKGVVAGLYVAADLENGVFFDLSSVYADHNVKSERQVATSVIDLGRVTSRRDGWSASVDGRLGYAASIGAFRVAPFVGVRQMWTRLDGAQEDGGEAAFRLSRQTLEETQGRAGLGLGAQFDLGGWAVSPSVDAAYVRSLSFDDGGVAARFEGAPSAMRFGASPHDDEWSEVMARLSVSHGGLSMAVAYGGVFNREDEAGATSSVRIGWRF